MRDGDHYVVNGQKVFTSRARQSDLMTLLVRTTPVDQVKRRTEGLSVLLVDLREAEGLTIRPIETMVNHQSNEVFFADVRVPVENLIGEEGQGFRYILDGMNAERILVAGEMLGDSRYFIDKAPRTTSRTERVVFGQPDPAKTRGSVVDRAPMRNNAAPTTGDAPLGALFSGRQALRRGGQHGEAPRLGSGLARRRSLHADARNHFNRARSPTSGASGARPHPAHPSAGL